MPGSIGLSKRDNGTTLQVQLGSVITIRLEENPTTGYRWTHEPAPGLEQVASQFQAGSTAAGAAGVRALQLRAARVGSYALRMKNWREWEGEKSVIERFQATIIVK